MGSRPLGGGILGRIILLAIQYLSVVSTPDMKTIKQRRTRPGTFKSPIQVKQSSLLPVSTVDLKKAQEKFFALWSNPLNTDDDTILSRKLGVPVSVIADWKADPILGDQASRLFLTNIRINTIPILRNLIAQAKDGSARAIDKFLEVAGLVESKGATINLNIGGGGGDPLQLAFIQELSDEDLDREINRLFTSLYASDIRIQEGDISPVFDAEIVGIHAAGS